MNWFICRSILIFGLIFLTACESNSKYQKKAELIRGKLIEAISVTSAVSAKENGDNR